MVSEPELGDVPAILGVEAEQLAKLRSELDVVQQNCKVMGEMLTELTPGQEPLEDDWQLLTVRLHLLFSTRPKGSYYVLSSFKLKIAISSWYGYWMKALI